MRIDLPVDAHIPPDYVTSDRLRLEGYRKLAAAADTDAIAAVVEELVDRYGPLPEEVGRLVSVAKLRLLCREYGIEEWPSPAPSSRSRPCNFRTRNSCGSSACTRARSTGRLPGWCRCRCRVPVRVASERTVRDVELLQYIANFLLAMDGKAADSVDLGSATGVQAGV